MTADPCGLVPINVLTGYLGAGKTTLLAALLRQPDLRRTAVVVNELGEIGLDHDLLERSEETLLTLEGGCLCCTVRGDLVRALDRLWRERARGRAEFDRVGIETTGLADPAPILQTLILDPVVAHRFRLDGVVTLIDAVNGAGTLETAPEAVRQAAVADRLVVSEADLVEPAALAALEAGLRALNPLAPIHRAVRGALDPAAILECGPWSAVGRRPEVERWLGEVDPPGPQLANGSGRADVAGGVPAACGHGHGAGAGHAHGHRASHGLDHPAGADRRQVSGHGRGPGNGAGGGHPHGEPRARAPRAGPGGDGPAEELGHDRGPGPGDGRAGGQSGGGTDAVGDAAPAEAREGGRAERPGDGRRQGPREARPNGAAAGPGEATRSVPARHASAIRTFCVRRAEPISAAAASLFLTLLGAQRGPDLLRVKGILAIREDLDRPLVVHAVQHVVHEPVELDHWPSADRSSRLVMVTRDPPPEAVEALWDTVVDYEATAGHESDRVSA